LSSSSEINSLEILFITVASNTIGFGHLSRCLALASYARSCGAKVKFHIFGSLIAQSKIEADGYRCSFLPGKNLSSVSGEWFKSNEIESDVIITDVLYPGFAENCHNPEGLFQYIRSKTRMSVALDVLGNFTIVKNLRQLDVDFVIMPYVGPEFETPISSRWELLEGAKYALLPLQYANLPQRLHRPGGNRVLITCGGSDPKSFTPKILKGLELVERELEIRVIIGPLFNNDLINEIASLAGESRHRVEIVNAPNSLLHEMLWCDVAISASGLTKYELAASGTPSLLFSIDGFQDEINRSFLAEGIAINLGVGISKDVLVKKIVDLLDDLELRVKLATISKKIVDGRGIERLFQSFNFKLNNKC